MEKIPTRGSAFGNVQMRHLLFQNTTVRSAAKEFGISTSTVHTVLDGGEVNRQTVRYRNQHL